MWATFTAYITAIIVFFSSLFGVPLRDGSVENDGYTYKNLQYGHHERQVVDLYLPKNSDGEVGLILLIHGGGWKAGSKEEYVNTAPSYVEKYGCAVAALNYRYVSEVYDLHDLLDDVENCLDRVKEIAKEKGISLNGVLLTGVSAGGHLSMLYAYARKDTSPIEPKAVISNSGPADLTDENLYHCNPLGSEEEIASLLSQTCGKRFTYKNRARAYDALAAVSPVTYVNADTVPTVINHGMKDTVVPFSNALAIVSKLEQYGVKHDFNIYPNSNHGLESDPEKAQIADNLFTEYVLTYLGAEK